MPIDSVQIAGSGGLWTTLGGLIAADGTAGHRLPHKLTTTIVQLRDLSDAVHFVCMLHARHPGVIDFAQAHAEDSPASGWLEVAAAGFSEERAYLVRLVSAAGPLPSTPGQAESEGAVAAQRHALDMLAQSDRVGCAAGAAIALALDWQAIRAVLDTAANRLGIDAPPSQLPPLAETETIVAALASAMSVERAFLFGAQQLLAQQRGLWSLLEARGEARARH